MNWLANPVAELRRPVALPGGAASRLVTPAAAAALLGISRLLPESGFGLWLRLAAATLVVILPGRLVARCLGQRSVAATLSWSTALVGAGLALAFALNSSLDVALGFELGAGAVALAWHFLLRSRPGTPLPGGARFARGSLVFAGLGLGAALWFIPGVLTGDSFFHLGRIRKLDALGSLSLQNVGEFAHGGLHPGYAFPLWHGWMAFVARLAGVDPTSVALHASSLLAPLALVLAFEMGWYVFRSTGVALAVVFAEVGIKLLAAGHAGVYEFLWQPGTASTQLFVPAAVALFFAFLRDFAWRTGLTLAATSAALALIHPTYALFLAIPLAGFAVVRLLFTRGADWRRSIGALVAFGVPVVLAFAWLEPVVRQAAELHLGSQALARSLHHYRSDLVVHSLTRYSLAPARVDKSGPVIVAALALVPLAFFSRRRRWSALVLGGTVGILALELWPLVFPHFSNAVSLSQSRRAGGLVPFALAFAGGVAVVSRFSRTLALLLGLGCGIWLEVSYGGDFGLHAPRTQPALATWIGLYGGAAAIAAGAALAWFRRTGPAEARRGITTALAAFLFVLPVAIHGFSNWTPKNARDPNALTPGLIDFLRYQAPPRSVVFGDLGTGYRAVAYAPVYAVTVPPTHAANTPRNEIFKRRRAWLRFLLHPTVRLPERWGADWLVLRRRIEPVPAIRREGLRPVYKDSRFVVFEVPGARVPLGR